MSNKISTFYLFVLFYPEYLGDRAKWLDRFVQSSRVEINISFDKEKMPTKFKLYTIGIESVKVNFRMYLSRGEKFWEISKYN
jgi:hypothetical protein